ncbi:MAG: hypothetical protein QOE68_405, partial [Thermoanaerobaculia bacterium]|nr:hypothetical protein [Thermoanaerobaculia bacterium]
MNRIRTALAASFVIVFSFQLRAADSRTRAVHPAMPSYLELRARYAERLAAAKAERERVRATDEVTEENLDERALVAWDLYWRDHLYIDGHLVGAMADMSRYLRQYYEIGRNASIASTALSTGSVCPSSGFGTWTSLGPSTYAAPIMGKVTSVYLDPSHPNTAYAGADQGGLFRSANNGTSWTNLTDASHYPSLGVTSIVVPPLDPNTIYIGTKTGPPGGGVYGFGILKSTNGGTTWQEVFELAKYNAQTQFGVADGSAISKLALHPQDPNTIYALASNYVFRSRDAGATWDTVLSITLPPQPDPEGCGYRTVDVDILPGQTGVSDSPVLISTIRTGWNGSPITPCGTARSFLSTSGGSIGSFQEITSTVLAGSLATRIGAAVQAGNQSEFFIGFNALGVGTNSLTIEKFDVAKKTITPVGNVSNASAGFWDLEMEFSKLKPTTLYVAGTTASRLDLSGGFSSSPISTYWATDPSSCLPIAKTHADVRAMLVAASGTNDVVVLGTDGGIHKATLDPATKYTYATANWQDLTGSGLAINEFNDISGLESSPDILVGGTWDNGTFEYAAGVWR